MAINDPEDYDNGHEAAHQIVLAIHGSDPNSDPDLDDADIDWIYQSAYQLLLAMCESGWINTEVLNPELIKRCAEDEYKAPIFNGIAAI